jgi:cytoskeleton protein RodZ
MPDQSSNNVAEFFTPGPGERLRAARLAMGLDLAKVASELHLTRPVVEALEADQYSDVGVRVFVRGYLRNYARIVDIPVESILRQFDEKWPDDGGYNAVVRQSPTLPADGGPSRGWAGAMSWLLMIGTVVLFLVWWRGYLDEIVPEPIRSSSLVDGRPSATQTFEEPTGALLLDADPILSDGGLTLPAPAAEMPLPSDLVGTGGQAAGGDSPAGLSPLRDVAPAVDAAASTSAVVAAIESTTEAAPPSSVAGRLPSVAAPAAVVPQGEGGAPVVDGTRQIVMTFNGACWVDVRDSERRFKLFGEMPKGTRKVLGGQPPYKMVIGNAKAVTISINGRPFDLSPYAKGNVARFTLDP